MPTARWWKDLYARERESLGAAFLESLFERAPRISVPAHGAIIFPHTCLVASGHYSAAAARAVIESGCEEVLALGVLHAARPLTQPLPRGERSVSGGLRGIHGPRAPYDKGIWRDEFSLDNFDALLSIAAKKFGKPKPRVIMRYPFLTGEYPESVPGFEELIALNERGAAVVATADMIHYGLGYGTPEPLQDRKTAAALAWAEGEIRRQLAALARKDFTNFLEQCERTRSDFRDAGPVLAALFPSRIQRSVIDVTLVNYADVLESAEPTWVAAALATFSHV